LILQAAGIFVRVTIKYCGTVSDDDFFVVEIELDLANELIRKRFTNGEMMTPVITIITNAPITKPSE